MANVTYRAPRGHTELIKRAAKAAGVKGYTTFIREAAERVAREVLDEADRAKGRRALGALLDALERSDAGLDEAEAARLGVEAMHASRKRT
ncbi:MAG: DUF1778 domain-containing protein [Anaeromyxobacteraceae bacterium]